MEYYELGEFKENDEDMCIDFSCKRLSIKDKVAIINLFCERMHDKLLYSFRLRKWYIFGDHSWSLLDNIVNIFLKDVQKYTIDHNEKELEPIKKEIYDKIIQECNDREFKNNMISICERYFDRGETIFDSNTSVLGFLNGVWDFNEKHFRDGKSSDMIFKTVGYEYKEFSPNDPVFAEIDNFLSQTFPDTSLKVSFMEMLASSLHKETFDRVNIFNDSIRIDDSQKINLSNHCSSGKSTILLFIRKLFGDYYQRINCYSIIGKTTDNPIYRSSYNLHNKIFEVGQYNCEFSNCNLHGKRFVEVSEAEKGWTIDRPEILDIEKLAYINKKQIVTTYIPYSGFITYKPTFTMTLVGNWTAANKQIWNILFEDDVLENGKTNEMKSKDLFRVYPFETEFVRHGVEPQTEYEKKSENYYDDKFDKCVQPFMYELLNNISNNVESYSQKSQIATQYIIESMKPI